MNVTFPPTIQAIRIAETGGVEVIKKEEVLFPEVLPGHLVIKIEYLGINFIDTYFRQGLYKVESFPATLGEEASGTIVGLPSDPSVLNDDDYKKRCFQKGGKVAVNYLGADAEYISVPWVKVFPVPPSVSLSTAAAGLLQGLTVVAFMTEAYDVQQGDTILIHTVAGGVGLLLAQYGKHRGATVIGTTSTKEKAELARAHGADHVILYREEDTTTRVLEITKGEGVHCVFDGVGKDTFENNFKMIRRKGTIVTFGNSSGVVPPFSPLKLGEKNVKLLRPTIKNYTFTAEESRFYGEKVFKLIADGTLKVKIFKEYPFTAKGVQHAHRELSGGQTVGKLVVKVAD